MAAASLSSGESIITKDVTKKEGAWREWKEKEGERERKEKEGEGERVRERGRERGEDGQKERWR